MIIPAYTSLIDAMRLFAHSQPDRRAYGFLSEHNKEEAALTFGEFAQRVDALSRHLRARCDAGERALLVFAPGLDFLVSLFACFSAGIIAVPLMVPRRQTSRDSSAAIIEDCAPRLALTTADVLWRRNDIAERFRSSGFDWIAVDAIDMPGNGPTFAPPASGDIAFLQYTSGSTSEPKGVTITHGNLLANCEMIRLCHGNTAQSTYVSWLPLYHDMGLILNVLQSFYVGATCMLMSPVHFMQRPLHWLRAISTYRAEVAGGPNFGFDLCVDRFRADQMEGIDLRGWKLALNGAEPVMARTIERFAATFAPFGFDPRAMFPAYGMAEATVLISGGRRGGGALIRALDHDALLHGTARPADGTHRARAVVGCGRALAGERIAIVDPGTLNPMPPDRVGEIWVEGANVAQGYWRRDGDPAFGATIAGDAEGGWLRTGDLGFLDPDGELFIAGRIKDLIIIRGVNHYPQDIEATVQACDPALRKHHGAAFGIQDEAGEEKLVIVQEVERSQRSRLNASDLEDLIREAIVRDHEIAPYRIVLILPGQIPKTTSGKIQRRLTRRLWLDDTLARLAPDPASP